MWLVLNPVSPLLNSKYHFLPRNISKYGKEKATLGKDQGFKHK